MNLTEGTLGMGIGLPLDDLDKTREIIQQGVDLYRAGDGPGFFFTSHGPVTRDVDLDVLHQISREIHQITL